MDEPCGTKTETVVIMTQVENLLKSLYELNSLVKSMTHRNPAEEPKTGEVQENPDNVFDEIIYVFNITTGTSHLTSKHYMKYRSV